MENLSQNEEIRQQPETLGFLGKLKAMGLAIQKKLTEREYSARKPSELNSRDRYAVADQITNSFKILIIAVALSSCTTLKPGCHSQHHAARIAQLDHQYESAANFTSGQMQYRNWQKRPMKMTKVPFIEFYF